MPSNSTQRRSGSGKRPQRGNSGKPPAPKTVEPTTPAVDEVDEGAVPAEPADTTPGATTSVDATSDLASDAETPGGATPVKATGAKATGAAGAGAGAKTTAAKAGASKAGASKAGASKAGASKSAPGRGGSGDGKGPGGRPPGKGPAGKGPAGKGGGGRGRQPVKVKSSGLPWGNIVLGGIVAIVALSIIGYGVWYSWDASKPFGERRAQQIDGLVNYRAQDAKWVGERNHVTGKVKYATSPPAGGNHNGTWENCSGDVYAKQIPNEHAVHSLEHGAVWVTYNPNLPAAQVEELAKKVKGKDYMLMSPYPGLDKPISLQAWGFQLKVDNASDKRIDEFITQFRVNASVETGAACSNGVTATGDTPVEQGDGDMNSGS